MGKVSTGVLSSHRLYCFVVAEPIGGLFNHTGLAIAVLRFFLLVPLPNFDEIEHLPLLLSPVNDQR